MFYPPYILLFFIYTFNMHVSIQKQLKNLIFFVFSVVWHTIYRLKNITGGTFMSENIKYSKAETEKYIKTLKRASKSNSHDLLIKYAESPNINMRIAAAGNLAAKDYLIEDPDYRVSKTMAQTIIRNNPNSAHDFLSSPKMEIRSCAAIFLAEKGLLTENELEDLDIPIVRNLIFKRLYLKEIASIYKNGDIKTLLNDELNILMFWMNSMKIIHPPWIKRIRQTMSQNTLKQLTN